MGQIRSNRVEDIYKIINSSKKFLLDDFKIDFPENGKVLVKITFRASSKYSFNIEENIISNGAFGIPLHLSNKKIEKVLQTIEIPGDNKNVEERDHENLQSCINRISSWLNNLDDDIKNEFIFTEVNNISNLEEFEIKLNEKFPDENEKFTSEEKEKLLNTINELKERIEKLEHNQQNIKHIELLEESKNELEKYPKKAWWLKLYNRINSFNTGMNLLNGISDNITKLFEKLQ